MFIVLRCLFCSVLRRLQYVHLKLRLESLHMLFAAMSALFGCTSPLRPTVYRPATPGLITFPRQHGQGDSLHQLHVCPEIRS